MPLGLPRDRLDDVRVDLRQRVVARDVAERVGQVRVAAGVVQRVTGLVQERLVVVQPSLRARDQVDDARRVGRDHAGPRRLLRPVVEVELDVRLRLEVEAEAPERVHADRDGLAPSSRCSRAATACARRRRGTSSAASRAPGRAGGRTTPREASSRRPRPPRSPWPARPRGRGSRCPSPPRCGRSDRRSR